MIEKLRRPKALCVSLLATIWICCSASSQCLADSMIKISPFRKSAPANTDDLKLMQETVIDLAPKAIASTVALKLRFAEGSGVIVSADGYILTAAHVAMETGMDVRVMLSDGREVRGKTLGLHKDADCALVKITDSGTYPFAQLVPKQEPPKVGDWCLSLGHTFGFQADRPAPVRLGRVINTFTNVIQTDCVLNSGDSGGPVFDMKGRVIAINSRIGSSTEDNVHGSVVACLEVWEQLKASLSYPSSRFFDRFDFDRDGKIERAELPEGSYRDVFDRLATKFQLDQDKAYPIDELKQITGWTPQPRLSTRMYQPADRSLTLMDPLHKQGERVRAAFNALVKAAGKSTVEVRSNGRRSAFGTVVGADGYVLTKASALNGRITCRLPSLKTATATVLAKDDPHDLALLKLDASGLVPARWSPSATVPIGGMIAMPDPRGRAFSVGVLSVGQREIKRSRGMIGVFLGAFENGAVITGMGQGSPGEKAGLEIGDVITHVAGVRVLDVQATIGKVGSYRAFDKIQIRILRERKPMNVDVVLGVERHVLSGARRSEIDGPISQRNDDFPSAIQTDSVLNVNECGGPVVDLNGNVIGINIARADRTMSYALPSEVVRGVVTSLKTKAAANGDEN